MQVQILEIFAGTDVCAYIWQQRRVEEQIAKKVLH